MSNRYETMLNDEFEHGFAVDWMRKDLKICLDAGDSNGASLPVTLLLINFIKIFKKWVAVAGIHRVFSSGLEQLMVLTKSVDKLKIT